MFLLQLGALWGSVSQAGAKVVIDEIMYHPVELPAFDASGFPVLDLTEDVHEYIELFNSGSTEIALQGWRLSGGITFTFPQGSRIQAGGYLVVAKDPPRLARVSAYQLLESSILGPYSGQLGNSGDTIRLHRSSNEVEDSVSYSSSAPWPIGADALGADDEWTGLKSTAFQYRGRSLERISPSHSSTDPANWVASPLSAGPSPGRPNSLRRAVPQPVALSVSAVAAASSESIIRSNQPVRIEVRFSSASELSEVGLEYFVDAINLTNEVRKVVAMSRDEVVGQEIYSILLPGSTNRTLVRYRILANRGGGVEVVSPRPEDPVSWHAYYVAPVRSSANPTYEILISSASMARLDANISQSPRRITLPDPPGKPRESWNATEPAIFIHEGVVRDIRMRHHGSRYNRNPGRQSFKVTFPAYAPFQGRTSNFLTDKGDEHRLGSRLYDAANLPVWRCRVVDVYLNNSLVTRLEQEEMDRDLYERWLDEQAAKFPDQPRQSLGGFYKSEGVVPFETSAAQNSTTVYTESGEGPYYIGNGAPIPPKSGWTFPARYDWTWPIQLSSWRGGMDVFQIITDLWAARGDSPTQPRPNLATLREFLEANFDVDATLTYIAIRNWSAPFDNATHNHFLWRKGNGRWGMLPWDLDAEFSNAGQSVYWDEWAPVQPDQIRGPEWIKDSFLKALRQEYRQRLFILTHTLLTPANLTSIGAGGFATYATTRNAAVDRELALGPWYAPSQPRNLEPGQSAGAFPPASLRVSDYSHTQPSTPPTHAATIWVIRQADGSYAAPVFRKVSSTELTSIPIPFTTLKFGETYFWKATFVDANGHPSVDSVESSFTFGPPLIDVPLVPLDAATLWRYQVRGAVLPQNWFQPEFDDSSWPEGAPLFADEIGKLPEPIRTPFARSNLVSFYFRKSFVFDGDPTGAALRLRQVVDDGDVVYLNGHELWRAGMPAGTPSASTAASRAINDAVYEGPFSVSSQWLRRGTNVLAVEVHQASPNGADVVFGLALEARVPAAPGVVRLNEVLASNRGSVPHDGGSPDYVELLNTSGVPQPLDRFSLSDDPDRPGKYVFPSGTVIPPHGFLMVWCDEAITSSGLHSGFQLDDDGQTVALFAVSTNGYQLVDAVTFGFQVPDHSIGRSGVGAEAAVWRLCEPTPAALNILAETGTASVFRINEWMATSTTSPDWFELYNPSSLPVALDGLYLSDDPAVPAKTRIPALHFLPAHGFRQFIADSETTKGGRHVDFKLSASGDQILLSDAGFKVIDRVVFGPQLVGISEGRMPDGAGSVVAFPASESPGEPNFLRLADVEFSEIQAAEVAVAGAVERVELQNQGLVPVDLAGWWMSDRVDQLQLFRIPSPALVTPGGFLVLEAGPAGAVGGVPVLFSLHTATGGRLFLSEARADGTLTGRRTSVSYGPIESGTSLGPVRTSVGRDFVRQSVVSMGMTNAGPGVGPVIIEEIHYDPKQVPGDPADFEYLELMNAGVSPVELFDASFPTNGWRIRDAVSFEFPLRTLLGPGEHVLVVGFDPVTNQLARDRFLATYRLPVGIQLFGPFLGNLDNAEDSVELVKPGVPQERSGGLPPRIPEILVERVHYQDHAPWPNGAGIRGGSLQRRSELGYGNEPTNWEYTVVAPGTGMSPNLDPLVEWTAPTAGTRWPSSTPIALRATARDPDGAIRRVDFLVDDQLVGRSELAPFGVLWTNAAPGRHVLRARAVDDRVAISDSLPVEILILEPPIFVAQPTNTFVRLGSNTLFRVSVRSLDSLRYQWFHDGAPVSGATDAILKLNAVSAADLGRYYVRVTDSLTTVESDEVSLMTLVDPVIMLPPLSQSVIAGQPVTLSVSVTNTATLPIGYRWRRGGSSLPGGFFVLNSHTCFLTITNPQPQFSSYSVTVTNVARSLGVTSGNAVLTFAPDGDGDGMSDAWEQQFGFDVTSKADRNGDRDGDGSSNWEESVAGTDPTDPHSYLRLESSQRGASTVLRFSAVANRAYSVWVREELSGEPWELWKQIPASASDQTWEFEESELAPSRYYRLSTP